MPLNLVRNSKVFFTTNVNATSGVINPASTQAFTSSNTFELQVLDGFTFSQNVNNETVTLSEAGSTPTRGQRTFNTSLAPVDFSFSTYVRPKNVTGTPNKITAEESVLWNALLTDAAVATPTSLGAVSGVTANASGLVTIAGTAITGTLPTVGDVVVLSGIATTTPTGTSPLTHDRLLNGAGTVVTSAVSGITVQLFNFPTVAITATTLTTASTVRYSKCAWNEATATYSQVTAALSERNQLQKFGMLFLVDNVLYAVDNCALNQVTVDFGLDAITTAQWTGQATALREFSTAVTANAGSFSGGTTADVGAAGAYLAKVTDAQYITNKLSTVNLSATKAIGSKIAAGDSYSIPITGGSITINNNISYITPANLGIVNTPVTYYTGTRAISGNITAYLRTGLPGKESGELLADLIAEAATTIEPMFALAIWIGGSSNTVKVVFDMPAISMGIPAVDVQQVVSTNISFTAQGFVPSATAANNTFDLTKPTDLLVRYYA
jgi:hypothetical protein